MNLDQGLFQTVIIAGAVVAFFGYQFFSKGKNQARDETTSTYKDLNDALEKKVLAIETLQVNCRERITDLEKSVVALTADKMNIENILVRALREYFASNPKTAGEMAGKLGM